MGLCISLDSQLEHLRYQDIEYYVPEIKKGKVINVFSGSTFTLATKLKYVTSPIYKFRVKILGIEIDNHERENAYNYLTQIIAGKWVEVKNIQSDSYGITLADVYINGISVSSLLVSNNYATYKETQRVNLKHFPGSTVSV
ncbi:MAG: hypothetical protein EBX37_15410 [Alphaproteobacteria bacterium]|nr:hypothetical protein [Alphaproteobacteria bacterium]